MQFVTRAVLPDRAQDNDAANQEHDDKLEKGQLPARAPAEQANDDKAEKDIRKSRG